MERIEPLNLKAKAKDKGRRKEGNYASLVIPTQSKAPRQGSMHHRDPGLTLLPGLQISNNEGFLACPSSDITEDSQNESQGRSQKGTVDDDGRCQDLVQEKLPKHGNAQSRNINEFESQDSCLPLEGLYSAKNARHVSVFQDSCLPNQNLDSAQDTRHQDIRLVSGIISSYSPQCITVPDATICSDNGSSGIASVNAENEESSTPVLSLKETSHMNMVNGPKSPILPVLQCSSISAVNKKSCQLNINEERGSDSQMPRALNIQEHTDDQTFTRKGVVVRRFGNKLVTVMWKNANSRFLRCELDGEGILSIEMELADNLPELAKLSILPRSPTVHTISQREVNSIAQEKGTFEGIVTESDHRKYTHVEFQSLGLAYYIVDLDVDSEEGAPSGESKPPKPFTKYYLSTLPDSESISYRTESDLGLSAEITLFPTSSSFSSSFSSDTMSYFHMSDQELADENEQMFDVRNHVWSRDTMVLNGEQVPSISDSATTANIFDSDTMPKFNLNEEGFAGSTNVLSADPYSQNLEWSTTSRVPTTVNSIATSASPHNRDIAPDVGSNGNGFHDADMFDTQPYSQISNWSNADQVHATSDFTTRSSVHRNADTGPDLNWSSDIFNTHPYCQTSDRSAADRVPATSDFTTRPNIYTSHDSITVPNLNLNEDFTGASKYPYYQTLGQSNTDRGPIISDVSTPSNVPYNSDTLPDNNLTQESAGTSAFNANLLDIENFDWSTFQMFPNSDHDSSTSTPRKSQATGAPPEIPIRTQKDGMARITITRIPQKPSTIIPLRVTINQHKCDLTPLPRSTPEADQSTFESSAMNSPSTAPSAPQTSSKRPSADGRPLDTGRKRPRTLAAAPPATGLPQSGSPEDPECLHATIRRLTEENKHLRQERDEAKRQLEAWRGVSKEVAVSNDKMHNVRPQSTLGMIGHAGFQHQAGAITPVHAPAPAPGPLLAPLTRTPSPAYVSPYGAAPPPLRPTEPPPRRANRVVSQFAYVEPSFGPPPPRRAVTAGSSLDNPLDLSSTGPSLDFAAEAVASNPSAAIRAEEEEEEEEEEEDDGLGDAIDEELEKWAMEEEENL
ncbi:hypothetical protein MMC14_008363 [Varicellaria rhodocarpa]|nr:hypothetical protein [Varicellaria rhodocarpa]